MDGFTSKNTGGVSLQQPQPPVLQRLLRQQLCLRREEGSWQEQLFSSAHMCSTSSTVNKFSRFQQVGRFRCAENTDISENETPHWFELHALSSPQNKSLRKIATMRLGCSVWSWRGNCSDAQRVGMRAYSSEVSAIYRILIG